MRQKGNETKTKILEASEKLFKEKGFYSVTMTDLCSETGLSRGGLYRYFSSTEEAFLALLTSDKEDWKEQMDKAIEAKTPATQMLSYFLYKTKADIAEGSGRLSLATYEYERTGEEIHHFLVERYNHAVDMMECLFVYGQKRGEFKKFTPHQEAEHIVIFLDGLKMASSALSLSTRTIEKQLDMILDKIVKNGEE